MNHYATRILIVFIASTLSAAQDVQPPADPAAAAVIEALAKSHPIAFSKTVGQDKLYYYMGDETKLSEFLSLYAAIQQPQHRLLIDGKWNAITGQPVEPFRYDWMLSISHDWKPAGDPNRQWPRVHIAANSDRIAWQYLVIPESVTLVSYASSDPDGRISAIMQAAQWSKAVAAWNDFAAKELSRIAKEEGRPSPQWMEMRSSELSQWLPEYRVFAMETNRSGRPSTYAVDKAGNIVTLGSGDWRGKEGEPFRNPELTGFLKKARLKITDHNDAISLAKLVEDLSAASSTISFIKINTLNFRVFDRRFYGMLKESKHDWRYSATRGTGCWSVKKEYVGPPACIIVPFQPSLIVDANDVLTDIENYRGG